MMRPTMVTRRGNVVEIGLAGPDAVIVASLADSDAEQLAAQITRVLPPRPAENGMTSAKEGGDQVGNQ